MSQPEDLHSVFDNLLGPGPGVMPNPLRLALHGQNAPLCAQYVFMLLHALPRQVARYPRSAEFRNAARAHWATQPRYYLEATRTDVEAGLRFLAREGMLPTWVEIREVHPDADAR